MADFDEKLESILNNPQAMSQIMSLAQSLGGSETSTNSSSHSTAAPMSNNEFQLDPQLFNILFSLINQYNNNDDQRTSLLYALRPFVKERRYAKLDKAIQIAKLSRVARAALELFKNQEANHV